MGKNGQRGLFHACTGYGKLFCKKITDGDKNMESVLTAVLAAAIKNKPRGQDKADTEESVSKVSEIEEKLPMYIYNF